MRRFAMLVALAAVATMVLGGTPAQAAAPVKHRVTLTGAAERPDPGDRNARGTFTWSLGGTHGRKLCYRLSVTKFKPAVAAHIHKGSRKVAGPVVVPLLPPKTVSNACVRLAAPLARDLREHPHRYYVNVHNIPFPNGGIRAQL